MSSAIVDRETSQVAIPVWKSLLESSRWLAEIVSGESSHMIIVKAAFDESGKLADQEYVVFAGCVATESEWNVISDRWQAILEENNIRYLTMKEAMGSYGEFKHWRDHAEERDRLLLKLANMIHPLIGFYSAAPVKTKDWLSMPEKERAKLRNPQYTAFEGCIRDTVRAMRNPAMKLHIFCDSSEEYSLQCLQLYIKLRRENLDLRDRCIAITFAEDEHFPPLQAADMLAYCVRNTQDVSREAAPVIRKILDIFSKDGVGKSGLNYKEDGPGLGRGTLEPMQFKK